MTRALFILWSGLTAYALTAPLFAAGNGRTKTQAAIRLNSKGIAEVYSTTGPGDTKHRKQYTIELKLVEVQEDTEVSALAIKVHSVRNPIDALVRKRLRNLSGNEPATQLERELMRRLTLDLTGHSFSSLDCIRCHSAPRQGDSLHYFWKTFLDRPDALKTWVGNSKGVKVLAAPTLVVVSDHVATFNVKSPRKLQYFRQLKNGAYALEEEEVTTGITIKVAVQEAGKQKIRLKPLSVSVTAVKGRESLDGVSLDVGKPILTTTSISTSVVGKLGKSSVISIDSPRGGRVLISVKVTPVAKPRGKSPKGQFPSAPTKR